MKEALKVARWFFVELCGCSNYRKLNYTKTLKSQKSKVWPSLGTFEALSNKKFGLLMVRAYRIDNCFLELRGCSNLSKRSKRINLVLSVEFDGRTAILCI